jgi:hypothetical protein
MLSDDDVDLADLTDEELDQAWDLWFDLAQTTNDDDPPWTHGVFQLASGVTDDGSAIAQPRRPRPRETGPNGARRWSTS